MRIRKDFKIKKTILVLFTFIIMMGVCSCDMENEKEKKKQMDHEVVVEMEDYLYDKYGYINYKFVSLLRKSTWGDPYDLMVLTTSYGGDGEAEFCVTRFEQDGEYVCADNYVTFLTADELEEEMKEFTSNYFSEFKLYANVGKNDVNVFPMSFKTFDDIKDGYDKISDIIPQNSFLTFRVYVKESSLSGEEEFNTIEEKYEKDLKELGFASCRYLYYVDDETFDGLE
ncbi:MAG: hypothetical protein HDT40_04105 [Lachnospiraceae bacterium]|nr:hypothetical protein [Lachnospiraceae bacterium]